MSTHPVTILLGLVGGAALFMLVGLGLSCAAYKVEPQNYPIFKPYYDYAKSKKVC